MTLTPEGYISRLAEKQLNIGLKAAGAVVLEGPRHCGKTWCARNTAESEYSLDDPSGDSMNRRLADIDPVSVLSGAEPHLIDEWQEVPKIWDTVRYSVDCSTRHGRYILCNSSSADSSELIHSGVGRFVSVRMYTMSLFESGDSSGEVSLEGMFEGKFDIIRGTARTLDELIYLTVRGGWPDLLGAEEKKVSLFLKDMIDRICTVDTRKADRKQRDANKLRKTFLSLARNESTTAAKSKIASDILGFSETKVEEETVSEYLGLFKKLFLIEDQPSFSPNYRSPVRVGKSSKRHLTDPSLAVAAMGLDSGSLKHDLKTFGFLFEALCERDLRIYAQTFGGKLYHYRDHSGREIDAVVEVPGKGWGAFEIKLGSDQIDEAARNLLAIDGFIRKDGKAEPPLFLCVICGIEAFAYRRPDGVYVVPICMLGP